jgi:hypothetical protein
MGTLTDWKMDVVMDFWMNAMVIALGVRVTRGRGEACFVSVEFVNEDTEVFLGVFYGFNFRYDATRSHVNVEPSPAHTGLPLGEHLQARLP